MGRIREATLARYVSANVPINQREKLGLIVPLVIGGLLALPAYGPMSLANLYLVASIQP